MTHPEADLQIQVADLLRIHQKRQRFIFWSTPNELLGSARTKGGLGRMARFKRMGLRSGVSDLIIIRFGGAFLLELKTEGGKQSENQKSFQRDAIDAGASYAVAHNLDEAIDALKIWGIIP
jgi:hypothetical protein